MSAPAPTIYYAVMAALAIAAGAAGLRMQALADAANRAAPYFQINAGGAVESLSGESIEDWLERLRVAKPFYFYPAPAQEVARPSRVIHGKVGDGQAATRLAHSNGVMA